MQPVVVSQEDYNAGNYPKGVPIMIGMNVGMDGKSEMNAGKKTKIVINLKTA
jgi:hypothetical protein